MIAVHTLAQKVQPDINSSLTAEAMAPEEEPSALVGQTAPSHPKVSTWAYVRQARLAVALTWPIIYACLVPIALVDVSLSLYQAICFPGYGLPRVRRSHYLIFDRAKLPYLNWLERINCLYCSYANGVLAYVTEIAARTEQHWCPIKHSRPVLAPHSRYSHFLTYGDHDSYRERLDGARTEYHDLPE